METTAPLDANRCPKCGALNQCAVQAGRPIEECWCVAVVVDAAVLEGLPEAVWGEACLCARCLAGE